MTKCLNCGKDCYNKYCSQECQHEYAHRLAVDEYNNNPKHCAFCGKALPWEQRKNKFCSCSCAASLNNASRNFIPKEQREKTSLSLKEYYQREREQTAWYQLLATAKAEDLKDILQSSHTKKEFFVKIGAKGHLNVETQAIIENLLSRNGLSLSMIKYRRNYNNGAKGSSVYDDMTKGEMFKTYKWWTNTRTKIVKHAWQTFTKAQKSRVCAICGYDKHIEIAHVRSVASFPKTAKVDEINDKDNLIPLCRNHHWEYDHNQLNDEDRATLESYLNNQE